MACVVGVGAHTWVSVHEQVLMCAHGRGQASPPSGWAGVFPPQGHVGVLTAPVIWAVEGVVRAGDREGWCWAPAAHFLGFRGEMSSGVPGADMSMGNMSTHSSRRP